MVTRTYTFGAAVVRSVIFAVTTVLSVQAADNVISLSPARVVELAATQSMAVKASECMLKAQDKAVAAAFASFFPTISGNASATHLVTKPEFEGLGGGSSFSFDSILTAIGAQLPAGTIEPGDRVVAMLLDTMFSGLTGSMSLSPSNIYSFGFNIAQPFFTGGKVMNAWRMAKYSRSAQEYTFKRTKEELGLAALQMYWGYVALLKTIESTRETRLWFEKLAADQKLMFDNGLIIELDVLNSSIQIDNLKLAELKLQNMATTVGSSMLLFLGQPAEQPIDVDTAALQQECRFTPLTGREIDSAIANRNDVFAAERRADMLTCVKKIQLAAYAPTLAGYASFGYSNQYSTRDELNFKNSSAIGAQLNWTLFDWGKAHAESYKTKYQADALKLQTDNMRLQIRLKIAELGRKVEQTIIACDIAVKDIENARKALAIAESRYNVQAITNAELLTARNQLTSKLVASTQARINLQLAIEEYRVAPVASNAAASQGTATTDDMGAAAGDGGTSPGAGSSASSMSGGGASTTGSSSGGAQR